MKRTRVRALAALGAALLPVALASADNLNEDSPLPATARRAINDLQAGTSDLESEVVDLVVSGSNLKTGLKGLLSGIEGLRVDENDLEFRIIFESDVLFDFDKWSIRPDADDALRKVASALVEFKGRKIRLVGHTDSKGSGSYNMTLSSKRANSVKAWLAKQSELRGFNFSAEGKGENEPIVPNETADGKDDPDGRQKNRRVEIRIPKTA